MDKRKPLIAGNWKMFKTVPEALSFAEGVKKNLKDVKDREMLVCAPFTALYQLSLALKGTSIKLGAQNMH